MPVKEIKWALAWRVRVTIFYYARPEPQRQMLDKCFNLSQTLLKLCYCLGYSGKRAGVGERRSESYQWQPDQNFTAVSIFTFTHLHFNDFELGVSISTHKANLGVSTPPSGILIVP